MFNFTGKVIVVAGAAGNLGQAVVRAFLAAGGTVCALDHQKGRLEEIYIEKNSNGKLFLLDGIDVTVPQQASDAAKNIDSLAVQPDVLVSTVGGYAAGESVYQLVEKDGGSEYPLFSEPFGSLCAWDDIQRVRQGCHRWSKIGTARGSTFWGLFCGKGGTSAFDREYGG